MRVFKLFSLTLIVPLLLLVVACGGGQESEMQESESNAEPAQQEMQSMQAMDNASEMTADQPDVTKLNLNTASGDEFRTIPGVGDRMVREFNEYRPYTSILQFRREIGKYIDEDQVAAYEQYLYVPISPNDADAATLQQIPGLDESEADELISARPFDSNDAFLQAVSSYVSEDQLSTAESYLASE